MYSPAESFVSPGLYLGEGRLEDVIKFPVPSNRYFSIQHLIGEEFPRKEEFPKYKTADSPSFTQKGSDTPGVAFNAPPRTRNLFDDQQFPT